MRNSDKALLGLLLQQEGPKTTVALVCSPFNAGSLNGCRSGLEEWLRWSAHPLGGAKCREQAQYPAFAPCTSDMAGGSCSFCTLLFIICSNCESM